MQQRFHVSAVISSRIDKSSARQIHRGHHKQAKIKCSPIVNKFDRPFAKLSGRPFGRQFGRPFERP
jgi:hypothetical protein